MDGDERRRGTHPAWSIYLLERRTLPCTPLFAAFDPPEVMTSCPRRPKTIVPDAGAGAAQQARWPASRQPALRPGRLVKECDGKAGLDGGTGRGNWPSAGRSSPGGVGGGRLSFLRQRSDDGERGRLAELCLALFNAE